MSKKLTEAPETDYVRPPVSLAQAVTVHARTTMAGLAALAGEDETARYAALALLLHDIGTECKDRGKFAAFARIAADTHDPAGRAVLEHGGEKKP